MVGGGRGRAFRERKGRFSHHVVPLESRNVGAVAQQDRCCVISWLSRGGQKGMMNNAWERSDKKAFQLFGGGVNSSWWII